MFTESNALVANHMACSLSEMSANTLDCSNFVPLVALNNSHLVGSLKKKRCGHASKKAREKMCEDFCD